VLASKGRDGAGVLLTGGRPGLQVVSAKKEPGDFGKAVRLLRNSRQLSQARLARAAGISPGYVGLIETGDRGERPSVDVVQRMAHAMSVTVPENEQLLQAAGLLGAEDRLVKPERPTFAEFITSDRRLTSDERRALVAVYEAFCGQGSAYRRGGHSLLAVLPTPPAFPHAHGAQKARKPKVQRTVGVR
jgi:transcriptional regulator with XRE-family HTH domain